jgi:hypothetical protein
MGATSSILEGGGSTPLHQHQDPIFLPDQRQHNNGPMHKQKVQKPTPQYSKNEHVQTKEVIKHEDSNIEIHHEYLIEIESIGE